MKTSTEGVGVSALPYRNVVLGRFGSVVIYMMAALRAQLNPRRGGAIMEDMRETKEDRVVSFLLFFIFFASG